MKAAMWQRSPGRLADLNPFDVSAPVEASQAPMLVGTGRRGLPRKERTEADAEYGCVDWYRYGDRADKDTTLH